MALSDRQADSRATARSTRMRLAYQYWRRFTVVDIAAMVAVDFAAWVKARLPESATALRAWYGRVSARPSAAA